MFTGITLKIKRPDKSFLAETGVINCCQTDCLAAVLAIACLSQNKTPKEKDLFPLGEHSGGGLLRRKYLLNLFPCCKSQFYSTSEVPAQESSFYRAWHNRPKKVLSAVTHVMFLIMFLYNKSKIRSLGQRPQSCQHTHSCLLK